MEQKKLKWKNIYNENKQRKYCQITGIKQYDVELESNSLKSLKQRKYIILAIVIICAAIIIWTFRSDIKVLLMVLGFLTVAGCAFFIFNFFRFKCLKDGLYVRFGLQEGVFPYDKIKSVYLSKYNDYSFLLPNSKSLCIVLRYEDSFNRIRELSFPNYFLSKEQTVEFLDNFIISEEPVEKFVNFEKFKLLKRIGKIALFVIAILTILGLLVLSGKIRI